MEFVQENIGEVLIHKYSFQGFFWYILLPKGVNLYVWPFKLSIFANVYVKAHKKPKLYICVHIFKSVLFGIPSNLSSNVQK